MTLTKRSVYVLAAVVGLALAPGPASAQQATGSTNGPGGGGGTGGSGSGGPGTLGSEVPKDSAVAQGYYHDRTRVQGDSDRRLEEGIRQLVTENRRAMQQAQQAATSSDPTLAEAAKRVADARAIADFNLLRTAQESGFDLGATAEPGFAATGSMGADSSDLPSYGPTGSPPPDAATGTGTDAEASASTTSPDESFGSTAQSEVQGHASTVKSLVEEARDSNRHQLASGLEVAQKALDSAAEAMAVVPTTSSSSAQ